MNIFKKQSGASLLTILLLLAVVGTLVLAGSRAIQETSRNSAVLSARDEARQMALSGIMEGLYDLNKNPGALTEGQYGQLTDLTVGTQYSLLPMRRGFAVNTSCLTQSAAETINAQDSTIDGRCPYYDLAIRDRAAYASGQTDITKFSLSSRDFPQGTAVTIPLRTTGVWLVVGNDSSINNASISLCTARGACGINSQIVTHGGAYVVNDPTLTYRFVMITMNYLIPSQTPVTIMTASTSPAQTVIGYGYPAVIEATGYSGDAQVHLVYTVRAGQSFFSELTSTFDKYGILK